MKKESDTERDKKNYLEFYNLPLFLFVGVHRTLKHWGTLSLSHSLSQTKLFTSIKFSFQVKNLQKLK